MAIAKSPFFTEISGRLGHIIFYTVNGQQRLRGATCISVFDIRLALLSLR